MPIIRSPSNCRCSLWFPYECGGGSVLSRGRYAYKNIKQKLHKTIAAIWFNKTRREKDLKPNYINIRINGNNRQCNNTKKAAIRFRINQEIQFLYINKQKLNEQLYRLHLNCANYWNKSWPHIQDHLEQRLQKETEDLYSRLNRKIDKTNKPTTAENTSTYTFIRKPEATTAVWRAPDNGHCNVRNMLSSICTTRQ